MHLVFPKNEPNLQRGSEKNCQVCNKKFGVMLREHQCKRCLKAVCSDCGNFKHFTFSSTSLEKQQHRICKTCKDSSDYITSLIKNNNLKFAEMSDIGKEWLKKITKKPQTYGTDTSQHKIFTKEVFAQLWASYSFELRELIGLLTYEYQQSSIYDLAYNVYATVVSAVEGLSLTKIMHLIMYSLCFCSLDKATILVLYLLQLKKQQKDMKNLAFKFVKALPYQNQYQKIENYVFYRYEKYVDGFFVNASSIQCSVFYLGEILKKKNLEDLYMFLSSHIYINREMLYLKSVQSSRDVIDLMVLRNCALLDITSNFKQIRSKNMMFQSEENNFIDKLKKVQNGSVKNQKDNQKQSRGISQQEINNSFDSNSNKPHLVKRQIPYNQTQSMQDSFSLYPQDDKLQQLTKTLQDIQNQIQAEKMINVTKQKKEMTAQQMIAFKKIGVHTKNITLEPQKCAKCQGLKKEYQILEKKLSDFQLQKIQLKDKVISLQAQILRLKNQTKQFDNQLVEIVHEKKTLQKTVQQTKKQLEAPINTSKVTSGNRQLYQRKLQDNQKHLQQEINKQRELKTINDSMEIKINQKNKALEQANSTIKKLKSEAESLNQEKQTLNGIIIVLKSDKKLLESKSSDQSTKIVDLQQALKKQIDQNKFLQIKRGQISRELQSYKETNRVHTEKIKMLQQKMTYIQGQNNKLNKQINHLISSWNDRQFRLKEQNKSIKNKTTELQLTIFSLQQQLKVHTSNSSQDMKKALQQTRTQYEQKLQRQMELNNQLQKEMDQLQRMIGQKQNEIDRFEKDNLVLLNQLEQKTKINEQLQQQLTSLKQSNSQIITVENDVRSKYQQMRIVAERNQAQIQKKNTQILKLSQKVAQKKAQIQQLKKKIEQNSSVISELDKQLQLVRQNRSKYDNHQQLANEQKQQNQTDDSLLLKQRQQKITLLTQQNTFLRQQLTQSNKINQHLNNRCEEMTTEMDQQTKEIQKMSLKMMTVDEQYRHTKVQLEKSHKQNVELKSSLKYAQNLLSQKQEEIRHLNKSNAKGIGEALAFEKLKEIQTKNEQLKHEIKELQKQKEGFLNKMDQLSTLMMQLQGQKLQLGEQNFYLKQVLQSHNLNF